MYGSHTITGGRKYSLGKVLVREVGGGGCTTTHDGDLQLKSVAVKTYKLNDMQQLLQPETYLINSSTTLKR